MLTTLSAILKSVASLSGSTKHSRRKTKGTLSTAASEVLEVRQVPSGITIGAQVQLGKPGDVVLAGNWNGEGPSSVFVRQPGVNGAPNDGLVHWYFDNNGDGVFENEQAFGLAGDQPVVGDWDGDGRDSVGVTRKSGGPGVANDGLLNWFMSTPTGWTHRKFGFSNDTPVVGNWNGAGGDDLGIVRPDLTWMQDWNGDTMPERIFSYGWNGDQPITGDWDGDGKDNVGVTRQSTADALTLLLDTNHDPAAEVIGRIDLPSEQEKSAGDGQVGILANNRQARPAISSGIDLRLGQLSNSGSPVAVSASLQNGEKITIFGSVTGDLPVLTWRPTLYSYGSESSHQIGRRERFAWTVNARDTANRFMSSSRVVAKDSKQHTALFKLQIDNVTADNNRILTIDVYEAETGRVIAKREIRRKEFSKANWNQEFALDFKAVVGRRLEFRTFWHGGAAVKQERVLIR